MDNKRSNQYDWFKGQNNQKGNDVKNNLKVTWKFTRIFLMFSIFFFSMWGCVQVFTHKISPKQGMGVEIVSKDRYNPLRKTIGINVSKTSDGQDVYALTTPNSNPILYTNDDILNEVRKKFNEGMNVGDWTRTSGKTATNMLLRFEVNNKPLTGNQSSTSSVVNGDYYDGVNKTNPLGYSTAGKTRNGNYAYNNPGAGIANINLYSWDDATSLATAHSIDIKKAYEDFMSNSKATETEKIRTNYNFAVLNMILNMSIKDPAGKDTTISNALATATPKTSKSVLVHNAMVGSFLGSSGITVNPNDNFSVAVSGASFFGNPGKTNTKIMANWGDAWKIGFGPFYGIFVYPIAATLDAVASSMGFINGWESLISIVLVVVVISIFMFGLSFKGVIQQTRMQELNAKKAIIDAKYAPYKGNKQMEARQKQEVSGLYKKEGISPLGSLSSVLITMPFFLAMWRVISANQHIKSTTWIGINFSATSWREWFANLGAWEGGWVYMPLMVIAAGLQVFSQLLPKLLTKKRDKNRINVQQKEAMKKSNKTQNIIMVVFAFFALTLSAGIQIYFIVRSLWRMIEVYVTHHILIARKNKKIITKTK